MALRSQIAHRVRRRRGANGGFPEPAPSSPVRLVDCAHAACGTTTKVRLPEAVPVRAVRRVVCDGCAETYACDGIEDPGTAPASPPRRTLPRLALHRPSLHRPSLPRWLRRPPGRLWAWLSAPLAAAAVIAGLTVIQGSSETSGPSVDPGAGAPGARVIETPEYTLALPRGWQRQNPPSGAAFALANGTGTADATLWVERKPGLSMSMFEDRSLAQLRQVAGLAQVAERVAAPTAEGTIVRLRADPPAGDAGVIAYEVTLRAAGPYRYYLSTTLQPDAPPAAIEGVELIHSSFVPGAKPDRRGSR